MSEDAREGKTTRTSPSHRICLLHTFARLQMIKTKGLFRGKTDDAEVKALASNHRDLGSFPEPAIYFCNPLTLRGD